MYRYLLPILMLFMPVALAQEKTSLEDDTDSVANVRSDTDFITLKAGADLRTHYFFRGMMQEDQGVIGQPWVELKLHLYRSNSLLSDVYVFASTWNSFHSGPTGSDSNASNSPGSWYETRFSAGLGFEVFHIVNVYGGYNIYVSPNDRFSTVEELFVRGGIADKALWNLKGEIGSLKWEFDGIRPYGMFAWETDGQRDAGINSGVYAETGAKPGVTLHPCQQFTIALSLPVSVGFNIFEYYEVPAKGDAPFGFFSLGFEGEIPLKWIPSTYGELSLYGDVHWYNLGQNVSRFNNRENDEVVAGGGLRFNY